MDKARAGYIEGIVSVLANTALFIIKFWAGIVTGSIALTADAWHGLFSFSKRITFFPDLARKRAVAVPINPAPIIMISALCIFDNLVKSKNLDG